jgi:hypothetical protein
MQSERHTFPNAIHRQLMQRLRSCEWRLVGSLGCKPSKRVIGRLQSYGWIEQRDTQGGREIRMTVGGLDAMRAKLP